MEKLPIKPKGNRFETILRNRKLLAGVGLLGGLFVLKASGCLEGKESEPDSPEPIKAVQPAPAQNESKAKAREALKNLKIPVFKKEEPVTEIQVPDDVGFGGLDPEAEVDSPKDPKKTIAFLFLSLPYEELDRSVRQTGFDEIDGMNDLMIAFKRLQEAIEDGDKEEISDKAKEFLRLSSILRTSKAKKKYREIKARLTSYPDGGDLMHSIKSVLIPACEYAERLASQ